MTAEAQSLTCRLAKAQDQDWIWRLIEPVIRAGETYALPRDMTRADALAYWTGGAHETFVAERGGRVAGSFFLQPNQAGGGAHVANCGYVTDAAATGRGIARHMCAFSIARARSRGFKAMQFNFVVSTNERAVRLWQSMEFEIVGRLPLAFEHPAHGFVDAFVMYRAL